MSNEIAARVLTHIASHNACSLACISESLDLTENEVRPILVELIKDGAISGYPAFWEIIELATTPKGRRILSGTNTASHSNSIQTTQNITNSTVHGNVAAGSNITQKSRSKQGNIEVFQEIAERIEMIPDENKRAQLNTGLSELQAAHGTDAFLNAYKQFMALASDHITVFGPILAYLTFML